MESNDKFKINYISAPILNIEELKAQFVPDDDDKDFSYNAFNVLSFQNYQPLYKNFFKMSESNFDKITFNQYFSIYDLETVKHNETEQLFNKKIFIKHSPLLDPIRYMIGKYDISDNTIRTLPTIDSTEKTSYNKLLSINNSSYVDGFFSFLSSVLLHKYEFKNSIDYFGSFLAVQEKYKMNITDDYEYLNDSNFFLENINNHFSITKYEMLKQFMENTSRKNRNKLNISSNIINEEITSDSLDDLIIEDLTETTDSMEVVYNNDNSDKKSDDSDSSYEDESEDDNDSEEVGDSDDEEDDDDEDSEEDDDESEEEVTLHAYINNFPVQMICLEKCDGTLDSLFENKQINQLNGAAALMQIVMTLIVYQKCFNFTHNDLHTNNIMYMNTEIEFLYYKYNDVYYKVPTYGKIFKLIDFGRSIYKFKGKTYCSDSFAPGGDAATQYNCEPYYNDNKPIIEPNLSFDLCRLGCSIYDFIIDEEEPEDMDYLQKTIHRWCLDDNNLNILYKKNGCERYPDFKLYKMIARTVHKHTPESQLEHMFFSQFSLNKEIILSEITDYNKIMNIDEMCDYM